MFNSDVSKIQWRKMWETFWASNNFSEAEKNLINLI